MHHNICYVKYQNRRQDANGKHEQLSHKPYSPTPQVNAMTHVYHITVTFPTCRDCIALIHRLHDPKLCAELRADGACAVQRIPAAKAQVERVLIQAGTGSRNGGNK